VERLRFVGALRAGRVAWSCPLVHVWDSRAAWREFVKIEYLIMKTFRGCIVAAVILLSLSGGRPSEAQPAWPPSTPFDDELREHFGRREGEFPTECLRRQVYFLKERVRILMIIVDRPWVPPQELLLKGRIGQEVSDDVKLRKEAIQLLGDYRSIEAVPMLARHISDELPSSGWSHGMGLAFWDHYPCVPALMNMGESAVEPLIMRVGTSRADSTLSDWQTELIAYTLLRIRSQRNLFGSSDRPRDEAVSDEDRASLLADVARVRAKPHTDAKRLDLLTDLISTAQFTSYEFPRSAAEQGFPPTRFDPRNTAPVE
jgi:hypothetical protein